LDYRFTRVRTVILAVFAAVLSAGFEFKIRFELNGRGARHCP
jgi:hypothetical protein